MTIEATTKNTRRRASRHYKQRFDSEADFVWRKRSRAGGDRSRPGIAAGDPVDKIKLRRGQLRRLWNAGRIELANWTPPGKRRLPTDRCVAFLSVRGRGRYELTLIERIDAGLGTRLGTKTVFQCHGLHNLLARSTQIGIRPRVEALLASMKALGVNAVSEINAALADALDLQINETTGAILAAEQGDDGDDGDAAPPLAVDPPTDAASVAGDDSAEAPEADSSEADGGAGGASDSLDRSRTAPPGEGESALDGGAVGQEGGLADSPVLGDTDTPRTPPPAPAPATFDGCDSIDG